MSNPKEKVCPAQNRRRTYMNAIERAKAWINTHEFVESPAIRIQEAIDDLRISFKRFEDEHQSLISWIDSEEFSKQDEIYARVQSSFQKTIVAYKQRIEALKPSESAQDNLNRISSTISNPKSTANTNTVTITNKKASENLSTKERKVRRNKTQNTSKSEENEKMSESDSENEKMSISEIESTNGSSNADSASESNSERNVKHENRQFRRLPSQVNAIYNNTLSRFSYNETRMSGNGIRDRLGTFDRRKESTARIHCNHCTRDHPMHRCQRFRALIVNERIARVRELGLCKNCFMPKYLGRRIHRCNAGVCKRCAKPHNSLLCKFSQI